MKNMIVTATRMGGLLQISLMRCFALSLIFSVLLLPASCNNVGEVDPLNGNQFEITCSKTIRFPLGEDMAPYTPQIQLFEGESGACLAVLNTFDNSIHVFDYASKKEVKVLNCNSATHGEDVRGFHFDGEKLYLYSYWGRMLYVANSVDASLCFSVPVPRVIEKGLFYPAPNICTSSPISTVGNRVFLPGFIATENKLENSENRPLLAIVDLNNKQIQYRVSYPSLYLKGNWGGGFFYRSPYTAMGLDGKLMVSLGASDDLIVYDPATDSVKQISAKSDLIKSIKPWSMFKGLVPSSEKETVWYKANASYQNIVCDPWKNCYYRFFSLPAENTSGDKPLGIIIFDSNMKKLGECLVKCDMRLDSTCFFVSEDGLYIRVVSSSEDELEFACFDVHD